jgi:hypothetical protein
MTLAWGKPGCTSMHVLIDCAQDRGMWMGGSTPVKSPRLKVGYRRMGAVDPPLRRQTGVAPIEPAGNGRSTIYT